MIGSIAKRKALTCAGFTMVEVMIALVILAIGLLGMAGMTMVVMRGSRSADDLANATNVCQQKIEELKDITWSQLGSSVSGDGNEVNFGMQSESVVLETQLNSQGLTRDQLFTQQSTVTGSACYNLAITDPTCAAYLDKAGPYKYSRSFSICQGQDYTPGAPPTPPSGSTTNIQGLDTQPDYYAGKPNCEVDPSNPSFRPQPLGCESNDILTAGPSSPEKMIKILCTWRTKEGRCSYVNFEALRMNNL